MDEKTREDFIPPGEKGVAEVDENDPWKDDALNRQNFAKPLTDWVRIAGDVSFGIAVDGKWGSGKTFLLQRWCAEFSKQGNKAIYFDAWEDDFHADPLTAIIGQLWKKIRMPEWKEIYDLWEEKLVDFAMRKIMKKIFKSTAWRLARKQKHISAVVKKAIKSVLCRKCIAFVMRRSSKYFGLRKDDFQTGVGEAVDEYLGTRKNIDEVKERLVVLARETKKKTGSPLVFIVDELDRCRPNFAIALLERIKHVVNVPNVVFVFGINQKELERSIQSVYVNIDGEDYFRRFFDVIHMPQANASMYCRHLINKYEISKSIKKSGLHQSDRLDAVKEIPVMVDYMGLSLSEIEHVVRKWLFGLRSKQIYGQQVMYAFEGTLAIFILLRIKNRDMCEKFFNGECESQEVMNYLLGFLPWEAIYGDRHGYESKRDCIMSIVLACYFFFTAKECQKIINEFEQASNTRYAIRSAQNYRYVPQKIIEMQNDEMCRNLLEGLLYVIRDAAHSKQDLYPPLREKIVDFLEWGDNWRD